MLIGKTWFANNNPVQNTFSVRTSGFPIPSFSISGAPSWLTIDKQTGTLTAKLTTKSKFGAFKITITASDGIGAAARQAFTANVGSDPVLTTTSATLAFTGSNALQLQATGTPATPGDRHPGAGMPVTQILAIKIT